MSYFLWTVIFGICPISRVLWHEKLMTASAVHKLSEYCDLQGFTIQARGTEMLGNTLITEHNTRSIYGRPKLSLIVPRNSGNRANPKNDSPEEITHKIKSSQPNLMILVLL